jgi:hypothetical protein
MNQEDDEDAFLYGDAPPPTVSQSAESAGEPPKNVNSDIELVSEGEVEDEEEDESDSVTLFNDLSSDSRTLNLS